MVLAQVGNDHQGKARRHEGGVGEREFVLEQGGDDGAGEDGRADARCEFSPEAGVVHGRILGDGGRTGHSRA